VALASGGYWLGRQGQADHTASTVADTATDGRKVLYWYDPMVPNQHFDKPGKSPFMDMQLVPKYADAGGEAAGVRVDPVCGTEPGYPADDRRHPGAGRTDRSGRKRDVQ
jgi:Cu(I)/Ag(I) efflux system membrane fusion protein